MSTIYLHIGSHKTGTSSVQRNLDFSREYIEKHGYFFFNYGVNGERGSNNCSSWFDHKGLKSGYGATLRDGFFDHVKSKASGKGFDNVVVSSECFSWIFDENVISGIADAVGANFDNVKVVSYIRRQDMHAVSHYQQRVKTDAERLFFEGGNGALPDVCDKLNLYLNYYDRFSKWGKAFGTRNVAIKLFDRKSLINEDVVDDFFEGVLDVPPPDRKKKVNVSVGWYEQKIAYSLMSNGVDPNSELGKKVISLCPKGGKLLPPREEAVQFYRVFREGNYELNKVFDVSADEFIFDDDFTMYPELGDEVWSDERFEEFFTYFLGVCGGVR